MVGNTGTNTLTQGLPLATHARNGWAGSSDSSQIIAAAVTSCPRTCMHTLKPAPVDSTLVGGSARTSAASPPGRPHAAVPWCRMSAARSAGLVDPPRTRHPRERTRQADVGCGVEGLRVAPVIEGRVRCDIG